MRKIALITGATAGIGRATAEKLSGNGYDLIITGRRRKQLDELEKELTCKYPSRVLSLHFDIRSRNEVNENLGNLKKEWKGIDVLINNAGLAAGLDHIHEGSIDDWEQMIDTNVKGLLYASRVIIPLMIERGSGHIINIGSIAGKETYEKGNVYCATKHAVEAITKGMRIDLLQHGIKVSSVSPGLVETEFSLVRFKGDREKAQTPYLGIDPLTGEDIADAILYILTRPQHVNINDILIMPTFQATATNIHRKTKE